jgi:hypothetical protein
VCNSSSVLIAMIKIFDLFVWRSSSAFPFISKERLRQWVF